MVSIVASRLVRLSGFAADTAFRGVAPRMLEDLPEEAIMRFFYRLSEDAGGWVAESEGVEAYGRGDSPAAAVLELREVLAERFERPNAVAPPSRRSAAWIDLEPVEQVLRSSLLDDEEVAHA
jgi:hypothetical protein